MIESFFMQNEWNDLFKYDRFDILVEVCKLFKKQKLSKNSPHKNVYKLTNNFIAYCRVGFEKKHSPHNGHIVSQNLKKVKIWKEFHLPTIYISTSLVQQPHCIFTSEIQFTIFAYISIQYWWKISFIVFTWVQKCIIQYIA